GTITVRGPNNNTPIVTLPDLDLPSAQEEWIKHDLTVDKRVHLIPEARLIVTIPAANDRLVLYDFGAICVSPSSDGTAALQGERLKILRKSSDFGVFPQD